MFERTRHRDAEPSVVAAGKYEAEGEIAEVISSALEKESENERKQLQLMLWSTSSGYSLTERGIFVQSASR